MKTQGKKLVLNTETLRDLTPSEAQLVNGGRHHKKHGGVACTAINSLGGPPVPCTAINSLAGPPVPCTAIVSTGPTKP